METKKINKPECLKKTFVNILNSLKYNHTQFSYRFFLVLLGFLSLVTVSFKKTYHFSIELCVFKTIWCKTSKN